MRTPATILRRLLAVGIILAVLAAILWFFAIRWNPDRTAFPVQGVDVSHHQGAIEWKRVAAAGAGFAYIKASEGADLHDEAFATNWADAGSAGLQRGAYHFFTLCRAGAEQATNFISMVPRDEAALPPALDLEFGGNCAARPDRATLLANIETYIHMVEAHSGKPVVLYLTREFDEAYRISDAVDRPLWLRRLFIEPAYGARQWVMWQASNLRRVDGIEGPVDWNVVRNDR